MSTLATAAKRLVLGQPFRTNRLGHSLLPKRITLPVFASDALSSVAYAPGGIFPGVTVTSVPWQLASAKRRNEPNRTVTPGQIRRGLDRPVEQPKARS